MYSPLIYARLYLSFLLFSCLLASPAQASTTNGTIDENNKYAWGENIGWINFGSTEGDVQIIDENITGYAWGENIGWISLNCLDDDSCSTIDYGISNDGNGNLSGHAWGENIGWIDFDPNFGGVTIDSNGIFAGYAWGENIGWIVFNCLTTDSCTDVDYSVSTDWLPQNARPDCNNAGDDDSDGLIDYPNDPGCSSLTDTDEIDAVTSTPEEVINGTGLPAEAYAKPIPPPTGFSVTINQGDETTLTTYVLLTLTAGEDIHFIKISEDEKFSDGYQMSFIAIKGQATMPYSLSKKEGLKTVYVKFCTQWSQCSDTVSDNIVLQIPQPPQPINTDEQHPDQEAIIKTNTPQTSPKPALIQNQPIQSPATTQPLNPPQVITKPILVPGLTFTEQKTPQNQNPPNIPQPPLNQKTSWINNIFNILLSPFIAIYNFFHKLFQPSQP